MGLAHLPALGRRTTMEWILHPLTQLILLAAGLCMALVLFFLLKYENAQLRRSFQEEREASAVVLEELRQFILRMGPPAGERVPTVPAPPETPSPAPQTSMNFTKRSQVLRMYRRGESAEQIAATLGLPRGEVDLLLKVHQATVEAP